MSTGIRTVQLVISLPSLNFRILNDIKGTNLPLSEIDGLAVVIVRWSLNLTTTFLLCGYWVWGVSQQLELSLGGISLSKVILYLLPIFWLGISPVNSISLGLRYRWLHIDEMDLFSDRVCTEF